MIARQRVKKRSDCRNFLTCENFVIKQIQNHLVESAQNPQHFLTAADFAIIRV